MDILPKGFRENKGGNYCLHDRAHPALILALPAKKNLPPVLLEATERIKQFYDSPQMFPRLNFANGSNRQMRSERRESTTVVYSALLKHTELASMRVGIPTKEGFTNLSIKVLAKACGYGYKRTYRALTDLRKAGFLTLTRLYKIDDSGNYKGMPAVKAMRPLVFEAMGLGDDLAQARKYAAGELKKLGKNIKAYTRTGKAKARLAMQMVKQTIPTPKRSSSPPDKHEFEKNRLLLNIQVGLMQKHPDWTPDQIREGAKKLLKL